jgi:hypothetical protein
VAGSALSALRFDYTFPNAPGSWVTFNSLSRQVRGNMTFEAWIALPLPGDGQFKPIVSRYPRPERIGLPDEAFGITHTNRFAGSTPLHSPPPSLLPQRPCLLAW